jgi:hypothetical protein
VRLEAEAAVPTPKPSELEPGVSVVCFVGETDEMQHSKAGSMDHPSPTQRPEPMVCGRATSRSRPS